LPKDKFFKKLDRMALAVTYNDVRLITGYSEVLPHEVSLVSKFSKNIELKIPIVSSPMDTVTEYKLAIEIAKLGGIGVIHKNLSMEEQAQQVAKVKRHLNGLIEDPITVSEQQTIVAILTEKEQFGYSFNTFPVIDDNRNLKGILSHSDFEFCSDLQVLAGEIMTKEVITAPKNTTIEQAYTIMRAQKKKMLPLIEEGKLVGMYIYSDVKRIMTGNSADYNVDKKDQLRVAAAIGVGTEAMQRLEKLVAVNVDCIVIDTAHADTKSVIETLKQIKANYQNLDVIVGNISNPESAKRLADNGADGIKVGQGPGSICTTRLVAGIGTPQVTAVYNCAKVADQYDIPVCADGGIVHSGDIPIAIGAGAYSVMLGRILAGAKESPGEIIFIDGQRFKGYRGMGSLGAMEANAGSRARYLQATADKRKLVPEGVEGIVPYAGELKDILTQYIGGLRAGMGYTGAASIDELRQKADFMMSTPSGTAESHPSITITREAPNYTSK